MLLSRFLVPTVALVGVMGGISTFWGMTMYKKASGMKSENWEEHVEERHGEMEEVAPGLFQVSAAYYNIEKYRNMTVLVLPNGNTMIHCPIALPEKEMEKVEAKGKPQFLFVPNSSTSARVDLSVYQKRYPDAKIICPESVVDKLKEHVKVDGIAESELISVDPRFVFINPPLKDMHGTDTVSLHRLLSFYGPTYAFKDGKETIIDAPLQTGQRALLAGELFWNMRFFAGLFGKLFVIAKLAGDGVQPQVSAATRAFGFESPAARNLFFSDFSNYALGDMPGTEDSLEPVPRYAAMTMQHGNAVTSEVHKKILRVSQAEIQSL